MTEFQDRELKDAAEKGEIVNFKITYLQEKMSKSGNSMIMCGLACTDSTGKKLDKLLYNYLVGTPGAARFISEFVDSLDKHMDIQFVGDQWQCDMEMLKGRIGKAELNIDENGYVKGTWLACDRSEIKNKEVEEITPVVISDDDIPF